MDNAQVTVIARAKARPGMEERLAEAAGTLISPTRDEEGCMNYDLHQSVEGPTEILFYENWRSKADLDRHLQTEHIKQVLDQLPELSENGVEITLYRMVSTPATP